MSKGGISVSQTSLVSHIVLPKPVRRYTVHVYVENWSTFYDWLIDYLLFYVPLKNISLIWRHHYYRWRAAKFRPMFGAQGLWAGRDLYRATPAVTRDLGFSRSHPKDRPHSVASYETRGDMEDLFLPHSSMKAADARHVTLNVSLLLQCI
jgi:hypothetical protein